MRRIFIHFFQAELEDAINIARKYNAGVELPLSTERLLKLDESRLERLKEIAKNIQLSIHGPFRDLYPGAIDPDVREVALGRYIEAIGIAKKLGAEWTVFHLNYVPLIYGGKRLRARWLNNTIKTFSEIAILGERIHLENTYEDSPLIFREVLEVLSDKNFHMCLDIGHANAFSGEQLELWVEELSSFIAEVHLHESYKGRDLHLPLGSGQIDINRFLVLLEEKGVKNYIITLEPASLDDLERNLEWLKTNGWL